MSSCIPFPTLCKKQHRGKAPNTIELYALLLARFYPRPFTRRKNDAILSTMQC